MAKFKINVGLNLPTGKRYEAGDVADDIPGADIKWLRQQGIIELVEEDKASKKAAKGGDK